MVYVYITLMNMAYFLYVCTCHHCNLSADILEQMCLAIRIYVGVNNQEILLKIPHIILKESIQKYLLSCSMPNVVGTLPVTM